MIIELKFHYDMNNILYLYHMSTNWIYKKRGMRREGEDSLGIAVKAFEEVEEVAQVADT